MRTESQINASRANGAKSRGPVTPAGKRTSSQNATKHGAFAKAILLPTESGASFDILADTTFDEFQPATPFEATLVEDMVASRWRVKRYTIMEQALIAHELQLLEQKSADTGEMSDLDAATITALSFRELADNSQALQLLRRYAAHFSREFYRAHRRLLEAQDRRRKDSPPANTGPTVIPIDCEVQSQEQTQQPIENKESAPFLTPDPAAQSIHYEGSVAWEYLSELEIFTDRVRRPPSTAGQPAIPEKEPLHVAKAA